LIQVRKGDLDTGIQRKVQWLGAVFILSDPQFKIPFVIMELKFDKSGLLLPCEKGSDHPGMTAVTYHVFQIILKAGTQSLLKLGVMMMGVRMIVVMGVIMRVTVVGVIMTLFLRGL
jgi:hypothetical protein